MLDVIRTHAQSWIAKVILALITVPFALWGIDSYFKGGGQMATVATVGKDRVTEREFLKALNNQRDSIQNKGGKVDLNNPEFRKQVLDQLVETHLISNAATGNGMTISEEQVAAMIHGIPEFMDNGQFSPQRMESWLRSQGLAQQELFDLVRRDLLLRQFQFAYGEGSVVADTSLGILAKHLAQEREVSELAFNLNALLPSIKIDDKSVEAEYTANKDKFATPPQARVQFLVLSMESIAALIKIDESAVKSFYESNKSRFQEPEQRRASHILIKTETGMAPAAKAEAKAKAEKLLAELRQNPSRFAELAKQNSQDPGSAVRGGDLGNFTREMMVKPFADAAFSLKVGELSGIVESDFGYHIIRLDGITPGAALGFAVVKDQIIQDLRGQEAQRKFAEVADRFGNLVYEKPDSLAPAAKELNLSVQESGWISRAKAEPAVLSNPRLLEAIFSPEAIEKKQNTEAIEVSPTTLVAARILEYKPAGQRPLVEVAGDIRLRLAAQAARAKAIETGKAALTAAQAGQSPAGMSMPMKISRMRQVNLPPQAVKAIFRANASKLPVYVGVELPDGYRLYRISQVIEAQPDPNANQMIGRDVKRLVAQEELRAYMEFVKARTKVEIEKAAFEKKAD
jgi:peptidyl-prolyl cis-trans isomerase D